MGRVYHQMLGLLCWQLAFVLLPLVVLGAPGVVAWLLEGMLYHEGRVAELTERRWGRDG